MAFLSLGELALLRWSLPRHVAKVSQLMANFEKRTGHKLVVVSGHRSRETQAAIYADSLKAGAHKGAQGYRAAPPGRSKHQHGAATDLNILGRDGKRDRTITTGDAAKDHAHPLYVALAEEAEKLGLDAGRNFTRGLPDPYHVEERESLAVLQAEHAAYLRGLLWRTATLVVAAAAVVALILHIITRRRASRGIAP